ncbi:hypothetical protein M3204_11750 [Mesobacillus subterraneus]|nr:hypothetical protein [Mesobacillus subterraneus]
MTLTRYRYLRTYLTLLDVYCYFTNFLAYGRILFLLKNKFIIRDQGYEGL